MIRKIYDDFQPHSIFLVDAIGASVSLFIIFVVLIPLEGYFGMPAETLTQLGILAFVLFFSSNTSFLRRPKNWKWYLLGIIIGNLSYCGVSVYFLLYYWNLLQPLGIIYFFSEKIVILSLVCWETTILQRSFQQTKDSKTSNGDTTNS